MIVDRQEGEYFIGRTEADSPEVDCEVLIARNEDEPLVIGNFYNVKSPVVRSLTFMAKLLTDFAHTYAPCRESVLLKRREPLHNTTKPQFCE